MMEPFYPSLPPFMEVALDLSSLHFKTICIHTELFIFKAQFELTLHSQSGSNENGHPLSVCKKRFKH